MLVESGKSINGFRENHVGKSFLPSTGYGNDDLGRDVLESVYAQTFGAGALVRPQIVSEPAIATSLFGVLRPGDDLLYITGTPP